VALLPLFSSLRTETEAQRSSIARAWWDALR
jgi:hypothetical protein